MAQFDPVPGDKTVMFDKGIGRLLVPLGGSAQIQLWGGAKQGSDAWPLIVDVNDPNVAMVSPVRSNLASWTFVYRIDGVNKGNAMLEARDFGPVCPTEAFQRAQWLSRPVYAFVQLTVVPEYLQSQGQWGSKPYKSTNPMWHNVQWTNMAQAGCGPTSLAIIMDYITTWDSRYARPQNACIAPNVTPSQTMEFTSKYGRAADKNNKPSGTDGVTMMRNLGVWWPGYASEMLGIGKGGVDAAENALKRGEVLLFLINNGNTFTFDKSGNLKEQHWGGHFMVLIGVDSAASGAHQTFFIADPSLAQTRFVTRNTLESKCKIWRVYRDPLFSNQSASSPPNMAFPNP